MNLSFKIKNKVYLEEIIVKDSSISANIGINENVINKIEESLGKNAEPNNLEQLAGLNRKLLLGELSKEVSSFCFTTPLFFTVENPLYQINYVVFTVDNNLMRVKINCSPNMKYLHHELVNPLTTIYNAAMLINLETENSSIKRVLEPYTRIIHNQVDNCNHITKTFLYNETSYQNINLFLYLKTYLCDYYNSYNYIIEYDRNKLKEFIKKEYTVRIPRNIIYLKIILDNIFKNAIFNSGGAGKNVRLDYKIVETRNCILEIANIVNTANTVNTVNVSGTSNTVGINKLMNISQSHYVGMELISKLCAKMAFKWNLVQNDNMIIFTLEIPLVVSSDIDSNIRDPYYTFESHWV